MQEFRAQSDGPFTIQPEEVAELRRLSSVDFDALVAEGAKVTGSLRAFARWLREQGSW